jgi:HD superfamily phosphohydrolase
MPRRVKREHEFRDPIHNFITLDRQGRKLVDSEPFQRLRHIHQLALTYLVYPGASHKRFEHSLGVMHLAGRVFDIVTAPKNRHPDTERIIPDDGHLPQWRTALCLAALCHDIGHLPFSHAAEKEVLPKGEDHESLTQLLIDSQELANVWASGANIDKEHVKKLAVGSKKYKGDQPLTDWESILSEIITGDSFGVDRMDYLMRDSYHLGVSYGRFDFAKLTESLRILPRSSEDGGSREPALGVEIGGIHSAEALLLARYFMYEQVYFHHVRRIYDHHLIEFMKTLYGAEGYRFAAPFHLSQTDSEVLAAMRLAAQEESTPGSASARAVLKRGHFRRVYTRNPSDDALVENAIKAGELVPSSEQTDLSPAYFLTEQLNREFGGSNIYYDKYFQTTNSAVFPVLMPDERIEISTQVSEVIRNIPLTKVTYIFADPALAENVTGWIAKNRVAVLKGGQK